VKRFKKILYVFDAQSDVHQDTVQKVVSLARLNDARVSIVRVEERSLVEELGATLSGRFEELAAIAEKQAQTDLEQLIADPSWQGIDVSVSLLRGKGFIEVIKKVLRDGHDLVIKEEGLEHGIDQLAMRLVRKCPCPVWIIRRGGGDFKRILGTVDIVTEHPEAQALNRKIVELTHSLAQREQGEAHFLHAWRLEYEVMLRGPRFNVSPQEILEMKNALSGERRTGLEELLQRSQITALDGHVHIREGESTEVISQALEELDIDVIVMGSVARSGIPGLLIGNRAEELLNSIKCTVLTVKPDDFISPVTLS
jgi:nucleotide-binding universal stress UspA family protein